MIPARIVYDALADEIFTAWRYTLCIRNTYRIRKRLEIGIYFRSNETRKLRPLSNGTNFNDLVRHSFYRAVYIVLCSYGPVFIRPFVWQRDRATPSRVGPSIQFANCSLYGRNVIRV